MNLNRRYVSAGALIVLSSLAVTVAITASDDAAPAGSAHPVFHEHLIADKFGYAYGVAAADIDGDGDLDLTSQDVVGSSANRAEPTLSALSWFENDGRGSFQRRGIFRGEPGWFERHAIGDINGDGRPDVAVVNNRDGHVLWFANPEQPAAVAWKRFVVTTKCTRAYDVVLADFDGDGDLDAAAAGYAASRLTWYENPGRDGWNGEWQERLVGDKMPEARTVALGDFNGDGRIDLLGAAVGGERVPPEVTDVAVHGSSIAWYDSPGADRDKPWTRHVVDDRARAPIQGHAVDLDRDGDADVLMAHGMRIELVPADRHEIAWYENIGPAGEGSQWRRHTIGKLPFAFEAVAGDLDGDKDVDVVATAWSNGDRVVWFENPGDPRGRWREHDVRTGWKAANQVILADLDGDGRLDIIATADNGSSRIEYRGANELRWWRNSAE